MRRFFKVGKMATMQRLYSLCKMVSFRQKIKLPKTCGKGLYKHITVVLCKKQMEETAYILKMRRFWKLEKWPLCKGYSLCKMVSFRQKIKLPKTQGKRLYKHITVVLCKIRMEETANNRKMTRFWKLKNWPLCKGYNLCKMVSFRQKIKLPKTCGKRLHKHIAVVLCKKRMEETANIRKMRRFWKLEKWPLCKGYSLCKMVSFRQKIKLPKTCGKRLYKHITVVLCKKRMEETANIGKMKRFWKLEKWPLCKGYSLCKVVSFRQKVKLPKTCGKRLYKHITVVLWKKRMEETANIRKMRPFWKLEKWPLLKGYSLCKVVSFPQKIKLPKTCGKRLYKHITVVLCKKRMEETANIWKMRRFWNLENWPLCKGYNLCKMISFRQKIKWPERYGECLYKNITVVLRKKRVEETANIGKMRRFWKLEKWPLCKGYRLCKVVSFRQKIKLPKTCGKRLYKHITVVLCKKRMEETANIRKMKRFWKLEKWPLCKGCSLCKMVSFRQKIKLPKTCGKRLYKHITVGLWKKRME